LWTFSEINTIHKKFLISKEKGFYHVKKGKMSFKNRTKKKKESGGENGVGHQYCRGCQVQQRTIWLVPVMQEGFKYRYRLTEPRINQLFNWALVVSSD